jgi:DNA-binding LacI/PurR family transcriptional regulator
MRAVHEAGRRIPEDLSIVGFDDTPEAPYFLPPLTTLHQNFSALGQQGVAMLLEVIKGCEQPLHEPITPALMVRASTAPPPRAEGD